MVGAAHCCYNHVNIAGVYMPSDTLITKVHGGMRIISADGVSIGKVWQVHFRDTEACIEVRPHTLGNALLTIAPSQWQTKITGGGAASVPDYSLREMIWDTVLLAERTQMQEAETIP